MAFHPCKGGCHCGNIRCTASLSFDPQLFSPRVCDCDYCGMQAAAYLSGPLGRLEITLNDVNLVSRYRQGGNLALFLSCGNCGVLVAVVHEDNGVIHGAINTQAVSGGVLFAGAKTVFPKRLGNDEMVVRRKEVWFPNVSTSVARV